MSEYQCQEPGCNFHIGIAGGLVTDLDFEQQDYYDQEVEEHEQMHASEADNEKQDDYFVNVDPSTAAWLDYHGLMRSWQNKSGQAVPNPLHVPARTISDVVGSPFAARYKEVEFGSVPVELPVVARLGIPELCQQINIGSGVRIIVAGPDLGVIGDVEGNHGAAELTDRERDGSGRAFIKPFSDALNECECQCGRRHDSVMPVDRDLHIQISLSVGAPSGAVVSTPESTERGQTPTSSEKGKPSAVAPAEGDETKTSKQGRCDFNA